MTDRQSQELADLIWRIADLLRHDYQPREYVDVILPMVVLRRLDQAIEDRRPFVWEKDEQLHSRGLINLDGQLRLIARGVSADYLRDAANGVVVYNRSHYNWQRLLEDQQNIVQNLVTYLNGYSPEVQDIIDKFDFRRQTQRLQSTNPPLLYQVMKRFETVDLHPDRVLNHVMGDVFENLIYRFNDQDNTTAGEFFTPREVVRLMVGLTFSENDTALHQPNIVRKVYDPACGTGGMLTETKRYLDRHFPNTTVYLFGQEINPTAYAVAKSDMLLKGESPNRIYFGNTFSDDGHSEQKFHYMLSNPPFGVEWKKVEWVIKREHEMLGYGGRFGAGLPRINDGSLLFLQHLISKMDQQEESRIAIVLNGSPLFTGDAGSGESEIRRWIIEECDLLEAIIALPSQLFYNTSINTYIWLLSNRKSERRKGKVQLINAANFFRKMKKSKGDKRNELGKEHIEQIISIYKRFDQQNTQDERLSRVYLNTFFGYRKVRIDRPLRLNFQATPERIARIDNERAFQQLVESKLVNEQAKQQEQELGRREQERIRQLLDHLPDMLFRDRAKFEQVLRDTATKARVTLSPQMLKAILSALSERDRNANICYDRKGRPEPDLELRDYENIPLGGNDTERRDFSQFDEKIPLLESVDTYLRREVLPFMDDQPLIDIAYRDNRDGEVGKIGYEIHFSRYFYEYEQPRPLRDIQQDIRDIQQDVLAKLREITGSAS